MVVPWYEIMTGHIELRASRQFSFWTSDNDPYLQERHPV